MRSLHLVVGSLAALAPAAVVAETSKSFQVTAAIVSGCAVALDASGRWGNIDFGTVPGTSTATVEADSVSAGVTGILLECTPGTTVAITADSGDNALAGVRRMMRGGSSDTIAYTLFPEGSATPWTTQAFSVAFAPGTSQRRLSVRGRVQLAGPMRAGTYTDTVRVTLSW